MGYSAEFDVTPDAKVHRGGSHLSKWCAHVFRDLDDRNGQLRKHANKGIDRDRTIHNHSWVLDVHTGKMVRAQSVEQVQGVIEARIEQHGGLTPKGKRPAPLTDQSVVMRPIVLGLDADWWDEHCPQWKEGRLTKEAGRLISEQIKWAQKEFGSQNICAASLHLDENRPQLQVAFVPINDTGQISQKSFFPNSANLRKQHDRYREHLRGVGYDATAERVTGQRSTERFSDAKFKREMRHAEEEIERRGKALDDREQALTTREDAVADQEAAVQEEAARRVEALRAVVFEEERRRAREELRAVKERVVQIQQAIATERLVVSDEVSRLEDAAQRNVRNAQRGTGLATRLLMDVIEKAEQVHAAPDDDRQGGE